MTPHETTRRTYLKYGGTVIGGGLLAGCSGDTGDGTATQRDDGDGSDPAAAAAEDSGDGSYTVEMAPMGEVTFDAVPESIFTRLTHLAGMAFALGRGNDVNALHAPGYYDALWNQFTPRLPGVELDWTGRYSSWAPSKERLYALDSDIHLTDPASVAALESWGADDIEEIESNISPFFGNKFSDRNDPPTEGYADSYQYYTLWEQFEKVAAVFREQERYEALAAIHDDVLATVESDLPAAAERPTVVMGGFTDPAAPYVYNVDTPGFLTSHVRPFGLRDAFEGNIDSGAQIDMETMADANPDVILALGGMHPQTDMAGIRSGLEDDPVGSDLTAVEDDRVYAQGARYQGPILNLFQIEMTAKQLYPEVFGAWPSYADGPYPEIPTEEQLFDRQQVADIITGEF